MIERPESGIDRVRARQAELINMMQRTRALVAGAEDAIRGAEAFDDQMLHATWTQEIHPGLGTVTIDGRGRLRSLDLEPGAVRQSDTSRLGERVLAAIHEAERHAMNHRREGLQKIFDSMEST
ncbi:MAG TPA: YbaB/EbfC family nucleoid-associated protein [Streptosporangiaceae bacterium]|nr:YbaB/EbfC family nucleoid-associated protein [Streptosporangiaceae bacterium]